mgnify:CR=1 FL=1
MKRKIGINRKSLNQDVSDELDKNYVVMKVNNPFHPKWNQRSRRNNRFLIPRGKLTPFSILGFHISTPDQLGD